MTGNQLRRRVPRLAAASLFVGALAGCGADAEPKREAKRTSTCDHVPTELVEAVLGSRKVEHFGSDFDAADTQLEQGNSCTFGDDSIGTVEVSGHVVSAEEAADWRASDRSSGCVAYEPVALEAGVGEVCIEHNAVHRTVFRALLDGDVLLSVSVTRPNGPRRADPKHVRQLTLAFYDAAYR